MNRTPLPSRAAGLRRRVARWQQPAGGALDAPATPELFPARLPSGSATVRAAHELFTVSQPSRTQLPR